MKGTDKGIQMLGPKAVLEGNLVFEGSLFMNGHAKGTIESRKGAIVVGEDAVLHADIHVRSATINGEIHGTLRATERVELHPPARVYGELIAPVVLMDSGVFFEGTCSIKPKGGKASKKYRVQSVSTEKTAEPTKSSQKSKDSSGSASNKKTETGA